MKASAPQRGRPALLMLLASLAGCEKGERKPIVASAAVSASAVAVTPPLSATSVEPVPLPAAAQCRAMRVGGTATVGDAPLASGALLDGETWVSLAKGASVALKHTTTGRELTVSGPALFRACRRGREQLLLAKGSVEVGGGMGARPGAEVLIATPIAALRYGEADFSLALDERALSVRVRAGQLEVDAEPEKRGTIKSPLSAKDELRLALGKPEPTVLMARCQAAAAAAEASARRVVDRGAPEPLGERAQAHVKARKAARATCSVAAAATGLVADPAQRAGLWADAVRWEGLWTTVPRR